MNSKSEYSSTSNSTERQMPQLSSYTIATNCTDITDLKDAIEEIKDAVQIYTQQGKKVPSYFFVRLHKLEDKLKKKQKENLLRLSVTTRFVVDLTTLEKAIKHCLYFHISPNKKNVIETIKNTVKHKGNQILDSPEKWDDDLNSVDETEFIKALQNIRQEFNL